MRIGELAALTGLTASRIRFYERVGILKTVHRTANGYREYPPETVTLLKLVVAAQQAGFSLDELRLLLPTDLNDWEHDGLREALQDKIQHIETLEAQLSQTKQRLTTVLATMEAKPEDMTCADNARQLLSTFLLAESD